MVLRLYLEHGDGLITNRNLLVLVVETRVKRLR